jgi:hypothetical protein
MIAAVLIGNNLMALKNKIFEKILTRRPGVLLLVLVVLTIVWIVLLVWFQLHLMEIF